MIQQEKFVTIKEIILYRRSYITIYSDLSASFKGIKCKDEREAKKKIDAMMAIKIIDGR